MPDLFNAFSGSCLDVSLETDQVLRESYSQLDLDVIYRDVNAYLWHCAPSRRPKNVRRFLINWCRKDARQKARQAKMDALLMREVNVGAGPVCKGKAVSV